MARIRSENMYRMVPLPRRRSAIWCTASFRCGIRPAAIIASSICSSESQLRSVQQAEQRQMHQAPHRCTRAGRGRRSSLISASRRWKCRATLRLWGVGDPKYVDLCLCGPERKDMVKEDEFCGLFKSQTLRNVATRDVFFYNGLSHTLEDMLLELKYLP